MQLLWTMQKHIKGLKHQKDTRGLVTIPKDRRKEKDMFKVVTENNYRT